MGSSVVGALKLHTKCVISNCRKCTRSVVIRLQSSLLCAKGRVTGILELCTLCLIYSCEGYFWMESRSVQAQLASFLCFGRNFCIHLGSNSVVLESSPMENEYSLL